MVHDIKTINIAQKIDNTIKKNYKYIIKVILRKIMHTNPIGIHELSSTTLLNEAYEFICHKRLNHSHHNSIWDVRFKWEYLLPQLQDKLKNGHYQFSPLQSYFTDLYILRTMTD